MKCVLQGGGVELSLSKTVIHGENKICHEFLMTSIFCLCLLKESHISWVGNRKPLNRV